LSFHEEVLSREQRAILPHLGRFAESHGFCLAGGTAVALYLGHRRSVDFDWFTASKLDDPLLLAYRLRETGLSLDNARTASGTLHGLVQRVEVSFFEYPYPSMAEAQLWDEYAVLVASLDDLACMKLAAVAQRGSRKDFIDLHAIAHQHRPLADILKLYQRKYSASDIAHLLIAVTYFDDADEEPPPVMLGNVRWDDVKRDMQAWAKALAG